MKFLSYIFNPKKTVREFTNGSLRAIFLDVAFLSLFIIIVTTTFGGLSSYFNLEIRYVWFPEKNIPFFLMTVLMGPILEELIFRAPLKQTKTSLYLFCIGYVYLVSQFIYKSNSIYGIIGLLSLTLILIWLYKYRVYKTHFKLNVIIYLSALIFSAIHFQNLDFDYTSTLGALVYVFPIFFGGLVLSYVRLKYSLLAAIIFHSLHNLVAYALFYFG